MRALPGLLILTIAAPPAAAQTYGTVVSASRHEQDAFDSPRAVDAVIPEPGQSVGQALEGAAGLHVQRSGRTKPTPMIRGLTGHRVLVMFDGLRLNDSTTRIGGNSHLGLLDPASIRRIEVVRGAASVQYGSDALGGVVRVIPQDPPRRDRRAGMLQAQANSSEAYVRSSAAVAATHEGLGLRLSGGGGSFGQLRPGGGGDPQPFTGHDEWAMSARVVRRDPQGVTWGAAYHGARQLDAPRPDISSPDDLRTVRLNQRDLAYTWAQGRWSGLRWKARLGSIARVELEERRRAGGVASERHAVDTLQAGLQLGGAPWGEATLTGGFDASADAIGVTTNESRGRYLDGTRYRQGGLFLLLEQPLVDRLLAEVGARATAAGVEGPEDPTIAASEPLKRTWLGFAGSAGLRFALTDDAAVMASVLSGFRSPNLEDLQAFGRGARGFGVPNPDIDEERSLTLDAGLKLRGESWAIQAFSYATFLSDLIVRVPGELAGRTEVDGAPVVTRANAGQGELLGGELELSLGERTIAGWSATASAGLTWGRQGELPLSKIPPAQVRLAVRRTAAAGAWWAGASVQAVAPQDRLTDSDRDDVRICPAGRQGCDSTAGYVVAGMGLGGRLRPGITGRLAVENLADSAYRPFASGVLGPGLGVVLAVRGEL